MSNTKVDKIFNWFKNHKIFSIIIVLIISFIVLGNIIEAFNRVRIIPLGKTIETFKKVFSLKKEPNKKLVELKNDNELEAIFGNPLTIKNYILDKIDKKNVWTTVFVDLPFALNTRKNTYISTEYYKGYNIDSRLESYNSLAEDPLLNEILPKFIYYGFKDLNVNFPNLGIRREFEKRYNILKNRKYPITRFTFTMKEFIEEGGKEDQCILANLACELAQRSLPLYVDFSQLINHQQENTFLVHWQHFFVPDNKKENASFTGQGGFSLYLSESENNYTSTYYRYLHSLASLFKTVNICSSIDTSKQLLFTVENMLDKFDDIVKKKNLFKLFWNDSVPKDEKELQELYYLYFKSVLSALNIEVNRDWETGNGPVDFVFIKNSADKILKVFVEIKLSHEGWKDGLGNKLLSYLERDNCNDAIYLCIHFGDNYSDNKSKDNTIYFIKNESSEIIKKYFKNRTVLLRLFDISKKESTNEFSAK